MFTILLVDDEMSVLEALTRTIPWAEFDIGEVHAAGNGDEALELLQTVSVHIVIADIRMPGMTGLELIGRIRRKWPMIKCILLSGYADFAYAQQAIKSGAAEYLLKPVSDEQLVGTVQRLTAELKREWEEIGSVARAYQTLSENLPLLKGNLLNDLLLGRRFDETELRETIGLLRLPQLVGAGCLLMAIRIDDMSAAYSDSPSLMEYAIGNIAEELFHRYVLWSCKDAHDYLVYLILPGQDADAGAPNRSPEQLHGQICGLSEELQHYIKRLLKTRTSIVVSPWIVFPRDIQPAYQSVLTAMRRVLGGEQELALSAGHAGAGGGRVPTIRSLYEPPTLIHLLEAGKWAEAEGKLDAVFQELQAENKDGREQIDEVFHGLAGAFAYIAHKNGRQLSDILDGEYDKLLDRRLAKSVSAMADWARATLRSLREDLNRDIKHSRDELIRQVRDYIDRYLGDDVSLQAIADHVFLHPVYLSKIYRTETGENITDYVLKKRMERAASLLRTTRQRIYEISERTGYPNTAYFIKVFKKQFGQTPQEYRDRR